MSILFCYWTWQDTLSQKLLEMAVKTWDGAQKDLDGAWEDLDGAREDRDFARQRLREAVQNGDEKERKEAREEFEKAESKVGTAKEEAKRAESKVQTAKEEATKAREELEKAKSTAPLQAGAFALLCSSCSPPLLVVGVMLSSQQGFRSSLSCFHCVGLRHFGEWPVLRSLSRLRLFLFEARPSGYCVREGESRESTLRSSRLPLAHGPCRAVGFRQDECRPGASAWACCLWFVALLHVRGSWSSCIFRAVHRCCFLG